jgi:hypothetical protein
MITNTLILVNPTSYLMTVGLQINIFSFTNWLQTDYEKFEFEGFRKLVFTGNKNKFPGVQLAILAAIFCPKRLYLIILCFILLKPSNNYEWVVFKEIWYKNAQLCLNL